MRNDEVVVITGASAGVGRAIARRFARDGARMGLLARNETGLAAARAEVERPGGQALVLPCDIAHLAAVDAAAAVEEAFGPIDVWINNAMTTVFAPFAEVTPEEFTRATEVTYLGAVWGTKAARIACFPATPARSCSSAPPRPTAAPRSRLPTVAPSTPRRGSSSRCAQSFATTRAASISRWSRCPGSTRRSSTTAARGYPAIRDRLHRSTSRRSPPMPFTSPHARRREVYVGWPTLKIILGNKLAPALVEWRLAEMGYDGQQTDRPVARAPLLISSCSPRRWIRRPVSSPAARDGAWPNVTV